MPGVFDTTFFNAEVFTKYMETIPSARRKELIRSKALRPRPDLASAMADQTGGNYISTPLRGTISGSQAQNYDGSTNIEASTPQAFSHERVVVGRSSAWVEKDFSFDVTGGEDFIADIAQQVSEYWEEVDIDTIVAILDGVFKMSGAGNTPFVTNHTHDVTAVTNSNGTLGHMDATTLNTGMQKACGDNKGKFSLAIMHSVVATNLENLKLLSYMKYNDENGLEREIGLATLNGRMVIVDDSMPVEEGEANKYTTYVLGEGAIEYTDCGAKVPYEVDRDPKTNGGQDTLYARQRKCFAPYGISFTKKSMATASPSVAELKNGQNWAVVKAANGSDVLNHKLIPIARIISLG